MSHSSDPSQDTTVSFRAGERILAGRYEIESLIGSGGFGSVYRARDRNLQRSVAVKLLRTEERNSDVVRRFEREAVVLARLEAPEIVPVYDYGVDDGEFFIVMQYVEGETLAALLARSKLLPPADAIAIARAICKALVIAHRQRIVHRDLKPSNVMLTPDGAVRLLDFGISKPLDAAGLTQSNVIGTPLYMSPEQSNGLALDERSDIFSLGCVLFEMLAGRRAFSGNTFAEQILAVTHKQPSIAALVEVSAPQPLVRIVARCLEKDAGRRYPSAQAVLDHLDHALDGEDASTQSGLHGWTRAADIAWPLVAAIGILGFLVVAKGAMQWQDAACLVASLPLLWIGRSYWRYLHWQYGILLFSLFVGPIMFSSTIPIFARQYFMHGWELPIETRQFIATANASIRYLLVGLIAATSIAKPVLRKYGYGIVRALNATPSRLAAFALALLVMGGIGAEFRLLSDDYFTRVDTTARTDAELLEAFGDAKRMDLRQPIGDGAMLDPRLRYGKLLLESQVPINPYVHGAEPLLALFDRIPAAAANRLSEDRIDVLKWWAARLETVADSTAARRRALRIARRLAPNDADVNRKLAELDFASARYAAALQVFEAEALRNGDANMATRAVSILAGTGRCDDARLFVRDFVGRRIVDPSKDAEALPDLLAPCRAQSPR
jgi:predicted Ser/Thr protein kinase